jgi:5'(3')-deoxyribonucleotidase
MRKKIAIDMDNVIVDIEQHWLDIYEKKTGIVIDRASIQGIPEAEAFPDPEVARSLLFEPGFFKTAPIMEGALEAVRKLMDHHEIYIVSAAMEFPNSLGEKREWLGEFFPFISWRNMVFCGDKSIFDTDYLIDDHVKNLDFCKGIPLMFTAAHNVHINRHTRVNNWKEVLDYFKL